MFRTSRVVVLAAGLTGPAPAQTSQPASLAASQPAPAAIRALLASENLPEVTTGAWRAAASRCKEVTPELITALRALQQAAPGDDHEAAALAILDALIRVDARLVPEELRPWLRSASADQRSAALLLAARNAPNTKGELTDLAAHALGVDAALACNVLLTVDPRALVAAARGRARIGLKVQLGREAGGGRGVPPFVFTQFEDGVWVPAHLPPRAIHRLVKPGSAQDARPLADGPVPIGCRRVVVEPGKLTQLGDGSLGPIDPAAYAVACLARLAGPAQGGARLESPVTLAVPWTDAATYARTVRAKVAAIDAAWTEAGARLARADLLGSAAWPPQAPIVLDLTDNRPEADRKELPDPLAGRTAAGAEPAASRRDR